MSHLSQLLAKRLPVCQCKMRRAGVRTAVCGCKINLKSAVIPVDQFVAI